MSEPFRAKSMVELRDLSDDELLRQHDELLKASHVVVGVDYYLAEMARRDAYKQGERMVTWPTGLDLFAGAGGFKLSAMLA